VEAIRAQLDPSDAILVSDLAYAGLRPQEAIALDWRHVSAKRLRVWAPKTRTTRSVDLLEPLADDLLRWRRETAAIGPVFPRGTGTPWSEHNWRNWRRRVYQPAATNAGVTGDLRPYRLRGSFVSLLLWEGRSVTYVAAQAGHSLQTLSRHYAGVLAELEDADIKVSATDAIRAARRSVGRALDALDAEAAAQGGQLSLDLALDQQAQCRTRTDDPFLTIATQGMWSLAVARYMPGNGHLLECSRFSRFVVGARRWLPQPLPLRRSRQRSGPPKRATLNSKPAD
jgi:hypothetical protein